MPYARLQTPNSNALLVGAAELEHLSISIVTLVGADNSVVRANGMRRLKGGATRHITWLQESVPLGKPIRVMATRKSENSIKASHISEQQLSFQKLKSRRAHNPGLESKSRFDAQPVGSLQLIAKFNARKFECFGETGDTVQLELLIRERCRLQLGSTNETDERWDEHECEFEQEILVMLTKA